ncbi:MAG: AmmeMemoRadiSam system radical SAM enzyme [Sedimentisphaerales bacterium]|nr:AmmeMemoRadiSam system radical SAM enzyme [Sedimentisphaerales bacterium]
MGGLMREAVLWDALDDSDVRCKLCNFRCLIKDGTTGRCQVRRNEGGKLYSLNYYSICASAVDPIEKKPLFQFQPGSRSFSVAAPGCNFACDFCQNWQISQLPRLRESFGGSSQSPAELIQAALDHRCASIAYTYTEPTIFMEYCADCGRLARQKGLANVFVSNGFMTIEALEYVSDFLDAINVDLKAFSNDFYREHCKASLEPVLESLRYIARQTDIWLEVTTLVIPGLNDSEQELQQIAEFVAGELGPEVPWHVSRFRPDYQVTDIESTPVKTMMQAYELGRQAGLHYVYVGNMPGVGRESTICHECGQMLIERIGYQIGQFNILNGACPGCGTKVAGRGLQPIQF